MSDIGDIGGEVAGMFIGVPVAIICVLCMPFWLISKGCEMYEEHKHPKVQHVETQQPKESLSFRAGQKTKQSVKDFTRGLFSKSN